MLIDEIVGILSVIGILSFIGFTALKTKRRFGENPSGAKYEKGKR